MDNLTKKESYLRPEARNRFIEDTNFDSEKLNNLIQTGYKKIIDQIKNSSIVLVVGCTGSGKSTLINYLLSNKINYVNQSMDVIAIAEKIGENYPEIGHDVESKTIFPEVFYDKINNLAYCDFPGFFDNRPYEERVSISINTQSAILNSKNVEAIIVVLSWTELTAQRGKLFKDLNKLLDSLICDFEAILPNIIFVLSKTNRDVTSEDFYNRIDELVNSNKKYLEEKFKNFANKLKQKWDPDTKERESAYKFLSAIVTQRENFVVGNFHSDHCRKHIVTLLKTMKMRNITKDNFNFDKYDADRMRLNNFISFIAYHGLNHIKNYMSYPKISQNSVKTREEISKKVEFYTNELERIEKLMTQTTYDAETNISNEEKKKRLSLIEKRLNGINILIENEYANLAICQEESENTKRQISLLDTDEPVLNWSKLITDKRLKFFGVNAVTKKLIKYKGIPYIDVKLSKSNGRFFDEIKQPSEGAYETKYRSERGRDGLAKVEIYVKKRDFPDNVKIIKYLRENILAQFEEEIEQANEQIKLYNAEKEYCNQAKQTLDKGITKAKLIFEKERITQKINEEKEFLSRLNERDQKYAKIYEKSKNFISDNLKIIDKTIVFHSNLVNEFLNHYEAYNNIHNKMKLSESNTPDDTDYHEEKSLTLNFYCPISNFLMTDPWVNVCGHSFEYSRLIEHIRKKPDSKCPICTRAMSKQSISPNNQLKEIINHWQKKQFKKLYSQDQNQHEDDITICDENEFKRDLESKKVIEEEIRLLKLNLEIKEFRLKEIDQRMEKWLKKKQKNPKSNRFTVEENVENASDELSFSSSPPQKTIPPPPIRPIPEPPKTNDLPYVFPSVTKPIISPKPSQKVLEAAQIHATPPHSSPPSALLSSILLSQQKHENSNGINISSLMNDFKKIDGEISFLQKTDSNSNTVKQVHENKLESALKNAVEINHKHLALSESESSDSSDYEFV